MSIIGCILEKFYWNCHFLMTFSEVIFICHKLVGDNSSGDSYSDSHSITYYYYLLYIKILSGTVETNQCHMVRMSIMVPESPH